jgi:hypothetical protein
VLLQHWDWLSILHCLVMETATSAAFLLTFWFWVGIVAIAYSGFDKDATTFLAHGGNVVMAALEVALTRLPVVSYHYQVGYYVWIMGTMCHE